MLEQILYNEITYWLLGTAIMFTYVGKWIAYKENMQDIVAATIDSLINEGYLKTKGTGKTLEILKFNECANDKDSG